MAKAFCLLLEISKYHPCLLGNKLTLIKVNDFRIFVIWRLGDAVISKVHSTQNVYIHNIERFLTTPQIIRTSSRVLNLFQRTV